MKQQIRKARVQNSSCISAGFVSVVLVLGVLVLANIWCMYRSL